MPVQTTKTGYMVFPDGALVSMKKPSEAVFFDVGAISTAVTATLNWEETGGFETANAGETAKKITKMEMEGGFTLINLDPEGIEKLGAGVFEYATTTASAVTTIPDQVIGAGWDDTINYPITMYTSSSDTTQLRMATKPVLTSVTLDAGGSPEVLAEGTDYVIVKDSLSTSGWSITFISTNMSTGSPKTFDITIDYDSNSPVATKILYGGSSSIVLESYEMKITHTDGDGKIRQLELFSVDPNTGGFQFNFKGANEDGVEEMPLTYTAKLDTSRTDMRQLFAFTFQEGAA